MLGLCCCKGSPLVAAIPAPLRLPCVDCSSRWLPLLQSTGSSVVGALVVALRLQFLWFLDSGAQAQELWHMGLVASQLVASSLGQGSNPGLLHWQADSLPSELQGNGKESACQCRRPGFDPWVGKIPWRREWQPTPVFLPGESSWTEEPGWLQSVESQRVGHN